MNIPEYDGTFYEDSDYDEWAEYGNCEDCPNQYDCCCFDGEYADREYDVGPEQFGNTEEMPFPDLQPEKERTRPAYSSFCLVTVIRIKGGAVTTGQSMLFSEYELAREWLVGNRFFQGENPWYEKRIKKYGWNGEWIHPENRPDDLQIASVKPAWVDTGIPMMHFGEIIRSK